MLKNLDKFFSKLLEKDSYSIKFDNDNFKVKINYKSIFKVIKNLKDNEKLKFSQLIDLTAVDYTDRPIRFSLVYILLSIEFNSRIILTADIEEDESVDSITTLFPSANWYEREAWDLFGIRFVGHPDLRRILTDYDFDGHPLRKDFPLTGFTQVKFDDELGKVISEPVKLEQEYRTFDNLSPWEGMSKILPGDEKSEKLDD